MKKYTIAEILHLAADKFLASKESELWNHGGYKEKFSCCAVTEAVYDLYSNYKIESEYDRDDLIKHIHYGLAEMGCPVSSLDAFNDRGDFIAGNQQARYAWLKFAAMIAEEQGV